MPIALLWASESRSSPACAAPPPFLFRGGWRAQQRAPRIGRELREALRHDERRWFETYRAGVKRNKNGDPEVKSKDVDRDGLTDMVLTFEIPDLDLESGDTLAELTGHTFGGTKIQGADAVEVKQQMCVRSLE